MSFIINKLNPGEKKFNERINSSFIGSLYNLVTRFIHYHFGDFWKQSDILKNLDNIYFVILMILIFAIPFVGTGTLGLLASLLIILTIINSLFTHKKFEFSTIHLPVLIYLGILIVSVGFSALFMPSLKGLLKMLIYIGAFFSFFEFLKTNPKKIMPVIVLVGISCSFELLFSLKQMFFGVNELAGWQDTTALNPENMLSRIFGTLKPYNPNLFAAYLLATVPCIFAASINSYFKKKLKISLGYLLFGLLGLVTIIKTGCRGAYIGLFFGGSFFAYLLFVGFKNQFAKIKNFKRILLITIGAVVLAGVLAIIFCPAISHRLTSIFTLRGDSSNSYRMNVYLSSLQMFADNFWIGIGTGNTTYRLIYGLYMVTGFDALGAYNIYLEMGVESGIFAILTFLWMMILTFAKTLKKILKFSVQNKIIATVCLSAILAMLFHGFFDTVWYRPQLQLIFWLYLAVLSVITMQGFRNE